MTNTKDQTPLGVSMIKNLWSLPIALGLAVGFGETAHFGRAWVSLSGDTVVLIALSGLGCFALSITYMTLYKFCNPTSITVAANLNKVLTIIVGQYLFGGALGTMQSVGLLICILASAWYSFESTRPVQHIKKTRGELSLLPLFSAAPGSILAFFSREPVGWLA